MHYYIVLTYYYINSALHYIVVSIAYTSHFTFIYIAIVACITRRCTFIIDNAELRKLVRGGPYIVAIASTAQLLVCVYTATVQPLRVLFCNRFINLRCPQYNLVIKVISVGLLL